MNNSQTTFLWKKIKKHRKENGFTQEKLAKLAEISYTTLTKIEIWVIKEPSVFTIAKIAKVLDINIETLLHQDK
jgi:DNA-binding XRE family transcriptional regulator